MVTPKTVINLRLRYIIALSVIALLVTASFITMQRVISEQRNFAQLVNLAGHQAGLVNRIAFFSNMMANTNDEEEFESYKGQVGNNLHRLQATHHLLQNGSKEKGIPQVTTERLSTIYEDPSVGLNLALERFINHADILYRKEFQSFSADSQHIIFMETYGPHVLAPLLDAAVEEYEEFGRKEILKIEQFEEVIWILTLLTLFLEVLFIFLPLEKRITKTLRFLETSITKLTATRKRLLEAQTLASIGDWQFSPINNSLVWSDQIFEICGVTPGNFHVDIRSTQKLIHPGDRKTVQNAFVSAMQDKQSTSIEYRIVRPNGEERLVYQQTTTILDQFGKTQQISGTIQDITERRELSVLLEKQSENIPGFIFQFKLNPDHSTSFPYASQGIQNLCSIKPEQVCDDSSVLFNHLFPDDFIRVRNKALASAKRLTLWRDQFRIILPDNRIIWVEGHATPERLGNGGTLWYGYIWNISDRKSSEDRIRELAFYDPLTGLANRRLLKDRLDQMIFKAKQNNSCNAILLLDMDNFKSLNDTRGHNTGDAFLVEVAKRLTQCTRESDTIARLGGDEFLVILENLGLDLRTAESYAHDIANKIRSSLAEAYTLGDEQYHHHASASIGIALSQGDTITQGELMKHADVAMFEAKELGKNRVCLFNPERQALIISQSQISDKLRHALERDELSLYYQPQVDIHGNICGAEALLRWIPVGGQPISPGTFIPIAECTGLIIPIGEWVIRTACNHINIISGIDLPKGFALSVNISARQFSDKYFLEKVENILASTGIDTHRLKLELTETCLVEDIDRACTLLSSLRDMGLHIELDDFGTGYSSLNSLKMFPLDTLKLDGSLIREIEASDEDKAILRAAIAMGKALSLDIVAEGVETIEQNSFLIEEGCNVLQGYLHAKPIPFSQFYAMLENIPTDAGLFLQSDDIDGNKSVFLPHTATINNQQSPLL